MLRLARDEKSSKGTCPETLQGLGIDDMSDPFGGQPLVYRKGPAGYLVYSLGQNMTDDDGTPGERRWLRARAVDGWHMERF